MIRVTDSLSFHFQIYHTLDSRVINICYFLKINFDKNHHLVYFENEMKARYQAS